MEVASETNPSATPSASASAASPSSNSALAAFEDASLYDESFMSALEDSAVTLAHELHSLNTRLSQGLTGALDTTAAHLNVLRTFKMMFRFLYYYYLRNFIIVMV